MAPLVQDWMTNTLVTVTSDMTLDEADDLLEEHGIRRLTVVDNGTLAGILSLGDVRAAKAAASAGSADFSAQPLVGTLMTPDPVTVPKTATLGLAAQTMLHLKVSGLPVVDENGTLCGMLSASDLFRFVVKMSD